MAGFEARPGGQTFMERWREAGGPTAGWDEKDRQRAEEESYINAAMGIRERRHDQRVGFQRDPTERAAANIDTILDRLSQQLSAQVQSQSQADATVMMAMMQLRAQNPWLQPENMERVLNFLRQLTYGDDAVLSQEGLETAMAMLGETGLSGIGGQVGLGLDPLASMNVR